MIIDDADSAYLSGIDASALEMLSGEDIEPLAAELVAAGVAAGRTVATAESLTAGLVCASIATVSGASNMLRGGVIVYATDLKASLAGVPRELLSRVGAVAPETAAELARGAAVNCRADVGLGLTGVAGPTEQEGKPVGTVYLGVWRADRGAQVFSLRFSGNRAAIRASAVAAALRVGAAALQ